MSASSNGQAITFSTTELIEAAEKVLDAKKAAIEDFQRREGEWFAQHKADWIKYNEPNIKALRDYLTKCLRNNQAPSTKDLERIIGPARGYRNGGDDRFFYSRPMSTINKPMAAYADPEGDLAALVEMLKANQADTVSASQLRNLGFKSRSIVALFRDVANARTKTAQGDQGAA
jgi:hypothetical protein